MRCTAKDKHVNITLDTNVGYSVTLSWAGYEEMTSMLIARDLNRVLEVRIQNLAKKYYDRGYKDAKAKAKKQTYFQTWLDK